MKIETSKFSFASAAIASAVYALCSVFVALFPKGSEMFVSTLTHVKSPSIIRQVTVGGFVFGLVQVFVYVLLGSWVLAFLLNRYSRK